jgi:cytochrome P450
MSAGRGGRLFGNGLVFSNGDYWLQQRRLIQPGFHTKRLQGLYGIIIRTIDEVLASFPAGEKIDIYPLMVRLSFEVALRSLLDMLLAARYEDTGEPMTEEALVGEVLVMLLAAHDYFQAVINEAMRLYSPAWVADREALTDWRRSPDVHR